MTTNAAASSPRPAFSLIELLVSIAIIALLIGILFPVLSGAMESARSVRCQANLRSLVTGLQMYQEDNDGVLPWVTVIPQTIDDPEPYQALASYLNTPLPQGTLGDDVSRIDPFACPSDRLISPLTGFSYSYMPAGFMQVTSELPDNLPDWRRLSRPYEGTNAPPVLQDLQRFHIDQDKWSQHQSPDQTGRNLAYLDGSVSKGKQE